MALARTSAAVCRCAVIQRTMKRDHTSSRGRPPCTHPFDIQFVLQHYGAFMLTFLVMAGEDVLAREAGAEVDVVDRAEAEAEAGAGVAKKGRFVISKEEESGGNDVVQEGVILGNEKRLWAMKKGCVNHWQCLRRQECLESQD